MVPEISKLYYRVGGGYSIIGKKKDLTEAQADEAVRRVEAEPKRREGIKHIKKWCSSNMEGMTVKAVTRAVIRMCNDVIEQALSEQDNG